MGTLSVGRTTLTRPHIARREGAFLVTAVCALVLLSYDQVLVGRGVLWMAPSVAVAVAYPNRAVRTRLSPMLMTFVGWLVLVSLHAGLPRGTFMLLLLCGVIAAGATLSTFGLDSVGRGLLTASGTLIVVSVAACLAHVHRAFETDPLYAGAWRGIFFQKNTLGFTAALLLLLCVAYFRHLPRNGVYALGAMGALALYEARSVSAIGALLYALVVFAVLEAARRHGRVVRPRHVIALLVLVFVAFVALLPHVLDRVGRDPTLTGRTIVWSRLSKDARADLTFGHGVGAYWFDAGSQATLDSIEQELHFRPQSAHDGALDAVLDGGLPGLALLVALAFVATRRASIAYQHGCSWPLLILAFALMSTATERGLYSGPMLFVVAAVLSAPGVAPSAA
jgi:exopolysaccharide production protein ExoQ